jgi:uncharacterized membrane protein (DUF485 family)
MADMVSRKPPTKPNGEGLNDYEMLEEKIYEEIESGEEFRALERSKIKFIVPATIFFMVYYFALPVLVGFFGTNTDGTPGFMDTRLFPGFSVAYLFALSQFIMAWILAFIYLLAFAPRMDKLVAKLVKRVSDYNTNKASRKDGGK